MRFRFTLCSSFFGCFDAQKHGPDNSIVDLHVFLESASLISYSAF